MQITSNLNTGAVRPSTTQETTQTPTAAAENKTSDPGLRSYLGGAVQDVQSLNNTPEKSEFYTLSFTALIHGKFYEVMLMVSEMSQQTTPSDRLEGQLQKSGIYMVNIACPEISKDFPELAGHPLVLDIQEGADSRWAVELGVQRLLNEAADNKGNPDYERRSGARIDKDYNCQLLGGKD